MAKFGNLKQFDPRGRTATMTMPIALTKPDGKRVTPKLIGRYAGDTNPAWQNALTKHNAKTGIIRKIQAGASGIEEIAIERDVELYPKHIITGWEDVIDEDGNPVSFSEKECREFLQALPRWVFTDVRIWFSSAANFVGEDQPTPDQIEEVAGN